ncbi:unnamed protein product [Fraxinus pennsylvanica]|uniref:NOT2/NOT3/NOT5 C-terminal domain-containing protein n=1 Tax=Fraxinus pennsylvanica TaxID=56036 RepID=A0AAD1ZMA6_9LAMI|nr:unnamed protein product [Fraxinus pennsylvanica]
MPFVFEFSFMLITWMQPATDGSNSSTPFYPQFGSSSGVLNQSGVFVRDLLVSLLFKDLISGQFVLPNVGYSTSIANSVDGLSDLGLSQLPTNTHQKEQMHDNMAYLMQYQQMAFMDNPMELPSVPNHFGMHGMLKRIKENPGMTSLAVGTDLTTLGLNLMSSEPLHKTFASPWVSEPFKVEPENDIPMCYNVRHPPPLKQSDFKNFQPDTLLYIFYSMPKDEAQLFAANELYTRGWFYHKELLLWFTRVADMEPLLKTSTYERGSYFFFNSDTWMLRNKDDFVLHYDKIERWHSMPRH